MQIQTANREISEKVFINVKNVEGATMTAGLPAAFALGVSNDGVNAVIANAAADYPGFIGVVRKDIANNDYGQVQIAGYVDSILISNVGSSVTIAVGSPLVPAAAPPQHRTYLSQYLQPAMLLV
jgi:predicted regulator of Ras-like GTPase activity (Roadblock/LC7/MglB family)